MSDLACKAAFFEFVQSKKMFYSDVAILNKLWNNVLLLCQKYNLNINTANIISGGDSAFVLVFNNFVIKICSHGRINSSYVCDSLYILQPVEEHIENVTINKFLSFPVSVMLQENLNTMDITASDVEKTVYALLNDGYAPTDIKKDNFGRNKYGTVVLLDYGELDKKGSVTYEKSKSQTLYKLENFLEIEKNKKSLKHKLRINKY